MEIEVVDYNHPLSPHFKFKFYYQGEIFQSAFEYLLTQAAITQSILDAVFMARVGQCLYLQKSKFANQNIRYGYKHRMETGFTHMLDITYVFLQQQFVYGLEDAQISEFVPEIQATGIADYTFDQARRIVFFKRAYPFSGKDRAILLTQGWVEQQVFGTILDPELSKDIAQYEI